VIASIIILAGNRGASSPPYQRKLIPDEQLPSDGYAAIAACRHRLGDFEGALQATNKALASDPTAWPAAARRTEVVFAMGRVQEAIELARDLRDWQPDVVQTHIRLVEFYVAAGDHRGAKGAALAAREAFPHNEYVTARTNDILSAR
jgi:tetratricopeptide (TPR) repeat protein